MSNKNTHKIITQYTQDQPQLADQLQLWKLYKEILIYVNLSVRIVTFTVSSNKCAR